MLKGKSIHLRTVRKADLDSLYELHCDVESRGPHFPVNFESETAFLERFGKTGFWTDDRGTLLIIGNESNKILGQVAFFKPEPYYDAYELGYLVYDPGDRGKGITSQAVDILVEYLFELKPVHRLQIQLESANVGSRRVAEKCGFKHEGTARHALMVRGKPTDLEVYAITREDFEKTTA